MSDDFISDGTFKAAVTTSLLAGVGFLVYEKLWKKRSYLVEYCARSEELAEQGTLALEDRNLTHTVIASHVLQHVKNTHESFKELEDDKITLEITRIHVM